MGNEVIKCMYEGELFAYLPKWRIDDEYDLPDDKLSEVMSSNKGDVVRILGNTFENIGSIEDILKEREELKAEVERLRYNLFMLSSALHGVLLSTEWMDVDDDGVITSSNTGEVLSE